MVTSTPKPKAFAWVRPLRQSDEKALAGLGREIPAGEILGLRTGGMHEKAAVLEQFAEWVFDIPHFEGHSGVLVKLDSVPLGVLEDLIVDAWLALAPKALAAAYVAEHAGD